MDGAWYRLAEMSATHGWSDSLANHFIDLKNVVVTPSMDGAWPESRDADPAV
jgi:hypothetical protein